MNSEKLTSLKSQLSEAYLRFQDVLRQEKNEYIRDAAIQRFEFTYELAWKTMKATLEMRGIQVYSPLESIRGAFQAGLIEDESGWLEMIKTRNLTSHVYNEKMAEGAYTSLSAYLPLIAALVKYNQET